MTYAYLDKDVQSEWPSTGTDFPSRFLQPERISVVGWRGFKLTAINQESDSALSRGSDHMGSRASFPPELFFDLTQEQTGEVAGYVYTTGWNNTGWNTSGKLN